MGKASKRERQKSNKALREEEVSRKESRKKAIRIAQALVLVLIVPIIIVVATIVNKATDADVYSAKITVAIDGEKSLPNNGIIEVDLDQARSPKSVKHFSGFASNGDYDGLSWHRVVTNFVIQGGDPNGDGTGNLGSSIVAELPIKGYKTGDLAWAKGGNEAAGTAGSQFFIVTGKEGSDGLQALNQKAAQADGSMSYQYGYIGKVTKGLELAKMIEKLAPLTDGSKAGDGPPTKKSIIVKIEIFKNGKKLKTGDLISPTTSSTTTTTSPTSSSTP